MIQYPASVLLAEARRRGMDPLTRRLEPLLTDPRGFALTTATSVQRAICRVADGLPLGPLASDPLVQEALGCNPALVPQVRPKMLGIFSGIRTAKSLITSALALRASQIVDVSRLGAGEIPRVSVLSLRRDLADVILDHLRGNLGKPSLRWLLAAPPTADSILVRHPSGRPVEIQVVAGARAGSSVVARWSAGIILDEAPRMNGSEDGVVNLDDVLHAGLGRLLPGAQIVALGSPWAPFGPVFRMVTDRFGRPGEDLVIFWCPATSMNPFWWTPERCKALQESDPVAYRTDVLAQFADSISGMFSEDLLSAAVRTGQTELPPLPGHHYVAAIDPATRANAWTLVIASQDFAGRWVVSLVRQWKPQPGQPLSPEATLREIAAVLRPYRISSLYSDQYSGDALRDLARQQGVILWPIAFTAANKVQWYDHLRRLLSDKRLELPNDPDLLMDLRRVRRRTTQAGVTIDLVSTPDGRHCDYAPALALAIGRRAGMAPDAPEDTTEEDNDPYLQAELAQADRPWWR